MDKQIPTTDPGLPRIAYNVDVDVTIGEVVEKAFIQFRDFFEHARVTISRENVDVRGIVKNKQMVYKQISFQLVKWNDPSAYMKPWQPGNYPSEWAKPW